MLAFLLRRTASMLLTMGVVSIVVFALLEVDANRVAGKVLGPYASAEQQQLWLTQHGYDRPVVVRYAAWAGGLLTGDLGESIRFKVPVAEIVLPRLRNTARLGALAFALMVPLALLLGVVAGMREGSALDRGISILSVVTTSLPEFASAVLLTFVFVFWLRWLPGTSAMINGFAWREMVLPVSVLVLYGTGYVARMTRTSMAEVMAQPYIRTAILKGLPMHTVVLKHALRNALIAPFTIIMLQLNWLLSGVVVTEFAFAYKGFGALLLEAALNQDIYVIEACAMVAVFVAVASQLLSDVGYALLNPRMRGRT